MAQGVNINATASKGRCGLQTMRRVTLPKTTTTTSVVAQLGNLVDTPWSMLVELVE